MRSASEALATAVAVRRKAPKAATCFRTPQETRVTRVQAASCSETRVQASAAKVGENPPGFKTVAIQQTPCRVVGVDPEACRKSSRSGVLTLHCMQTSIHPCKTLDASSTNSFVLTACECGETQLLMSVGLYV